MSTHLILGRRVHKDRHLQLRTQLLDVEIISAHNLNKRFCNNKLYASVYAYPDDQQVTKKESCSQNYETAWNDQFAIRVDDQFLKSETSTINVNVYAVRGWTRFGHNHLIGSTRIVISTFHNNSQQKVALQIREPKTLEPVGVLNIAISLLDPSHRVLPNNDHDAQITSTPHSCFMRFDSRHNINEDMGCAFLEQRRNVDKSGPLDQMQKKEQAKRKNIKSKIKHWKMTCRQTINRMRIDREE